jgi:hypothetical protein
VNSLYDINRLTSRFARPHTPCASGALATSATSARQRQLLIVTQIRTTACDELVTPNACKISDFWVVWFLWKAPAARILPSRRRPGSVPPQGPGVGPLPAVYLSTGAKDPPPGRQASENCRRSHPPGVSGRATMVAEVPVKRNGRGDDRCVRPSRDATIQVAFRAGTRPTDDCDHVAIVYRQRSRPNGT